MNRHWRVWSLISLVVTTAACDGGTPAPTTPSSSPSFLTGTWTGTLTIER